MYKYLSFIIILGVCCAEVFAQPKLRIEPNNLVFDNIYSKYVSTYLINDGNFPLFGGIKKDENNSKFIINFENGKDSSVVSVSLDSFFIEPGDSLKMNIFLTHAYNLDAQDTNQTKIDTIKIYAADMIGLYNLYISYGFFNNDRGSCSGLVLDENSNPIKEAEISFLVDGVYSLKTVLTDFEGRFSTILPAGNYILAAQKKDYQTLFSGNTFDPFFAKQIQIFNGVIEFVDFTLPKVADTTFSVSGTLMDSMYNVKINKGVVVVRRGGSTPTLLKQNGITEKSSTFSAIVDSNGNYKVYVDDSTYYMIQGYAGYYLPTYYNELFGPSIMWQQADSLFINSDLQNINLYFMRDSSYGGGVADGKVIIPPNSNYGFDAISVYAQASQNSYIYSYNFVREDGSFEISNLPFGEYKIIAQKPGFMDAGSQSFEINQFNPVQKQIEIQLSISDIDDDEKIPDELELFQNFPNPFNPATTISFSLPFAQAVRIKIFNLLGEQVASIGNQQFSSGLNKVVFNAKGLASGIYIVTLETQSALLSQKIALLK